MKNFYRSLITEFYSRYNKENAPDIPKLLEKYNGIEKELICGLFAKYSANPLDFTFFKSYIENNFKEYVSAFYRKFNPNKLSEVGNLVEKYNENKEVFIQQLCSKYNIEPCSLVDFIDFKKIEINDNELKEDNEKPEKGKTVEKVQSPQNESIIPPKKKKINIYLIIILAIIILGGGLFAGYYFYNQNIELQKLASEKKVADSVAMVQAKQQKISDSIRVADSLAMVQAGQQRISDSITNSGTSIVLDQMVGNWKWGEKGDYIISFEKDNLNSNFIIAKAVKIGWGKYYSVNQIMLKNGWVDQNSVFKGMILVPFGSGDQQGFRQEWFNFEGTVEKDNISITIGDQKWGWGFARL